MLKRLFCVSNLKIYNTKIVNHSPESLQLACELLSSGEIVALPTETVYGLAANATSDNELKKIYEAKNRPTNNPLIVHISENYKNLKKMVDDDLVDKDKINQKQIQIIDTLIQNFWPGPFTILLPRGKKLPSFVSSGLDNVGFRVPHHKTFLSILNSLSFPLAAPSANLSNHISPTTALHVLSELNGKIPLIVDGGGTEVGIESTIVRVTADGIVEILRPGVISSEDIYKICPTKIENLKNTPNKILAPGMQKIHYAPNHPLLMLSTHDQQTILREITKYSRVATLLFSKELPPSWNSQLKNYNIQKSITLNNSDDGHKAAKELYSSLRELDKLDISWIIAELPQRLNGAWPAIIDRLSRAAKLVIAEPFAPELRN